MLPRTVTVGPLAAASATALATAQRNYGAGGALALLGTKSDFVAGTVCATQAPGASALTINGTLAKTGVAYIPGRYIYINSSGDDHAITFAVVGTSGLNNIVVTETITGTNAQSAASVNAYNTILSITPSGAVAANATVGTFKAATLDTTRQLLFTTTANEASNSAVIVGTDWAGTPIGETLTLVNNTTVASGLSYKAVSKITITAAAAGNISVGTNGVAASQWVMLDPWSDGGVTAQFVVSGTVNYDVQSSNDDPNSYSNPVLPSAMTWDSTIMGVMGATESSQLSVGVCPLWARIVLNSGTGTVTGTFVQTGAAPL